MDYSSYCRRSSSDSRSARSLPLFWSKARPARSMIFARSCPTIPSQVPFLDSVFPPVSLVPYLLRTRYTPNVQGTQSMAAAPTHFLDHWVESARLAVERMESATARLIILFITRLTAHQPLHCKGGFQKSKIHDGVLVCANMDRLDRINGASSSSSSSLQTAGPALFRTRQD
jgi:hypothetical protein